MRTATGLPNGHVLVTSQGIQRVWELDLAGKTVWEYKVTAAIIRRGDDNSWIVNRES